MPHKIRVDILDLEEMDANIYYGVNMNYQGKPFTGFALDGYYPNGQVAGEIEYVDGEQMGWLLDYYENGMLEREALCYGQATVFFQTFDKEGNKTFGGFLDDHLLQKICDITGENPENVVEE